MRVPYGEEGIRGLKSLKNYKRSVFSKLNLFSLSSLRISPAMVKKKLHLQSSLTAFLKLIRTGNLIILALTQYMCAIFLAGPKEQWATIATDWRFFCLVLSTILIAAGGYIINDYYDVKIDIINKPKRVIVGKLLKRRIAIFAHSFLNFLGIAIGILAGWKIGAVAFTSAFLLWLYSNSLKRLPLVGNITVSFLTFLAVVLTGIYFKRHLDLIFTFAVFAFFISLIREIIKDMEDVRGDAAFGCRTLPLVFGIRRTKLVIYIILALFLLSLLLLGQKVTEPLAVYFLVFILIPVIFLVIRLVRSDSSKDFHFLSIWCKFIMLTGVISMLFI